MAERQQEVMLDMKNRDRSTRWIALMALFVALELFLNLTPIGLIPLPVIKGTTLHIPVIIGAIVLGPMAGGVLGGVFGLCSIWNNTMTPALLSFAFSPFIAAQELGAVGAVKSLWIVLGCRIMIGVVAGWLWIGLKKLRVGGKPISDFAALPITAAAGSMTNTALVMGSIYFLLRPEYAAAKGVAMDTVLGLVMVTITGSGVTEMVGAIVVVTAVCKALFHLPNVVPARAAEKAKK